MCDNSRRKRRKKMQRERDREREREIVKYTGDNHLISRQIWTKKIFLKNYPK